MAEWAPTHQQVHALLHQRVDGGFTETTQPTIAQVQEIVDQVVTDIVGETGSFDPAVVVNPDSPVADQKTLSHLAARAAVLGAASQVEDTFFPEQQAVNVFTAEGVQGTGSQQHLYARYRRAVEALIRAVERSRRPRMRLGTVKTPSGPTEATRTTTVKRPF